MQLPEEQLPGLSDWRDWGLNFQAAPQLTRRLNTAQDKQANAVYLISDGSKSFVLKHYARNPAYKNNHAHWRAIDRWQNTIALPAYSLAPAVHYRHLHNQYAIYEFIDGTTLDSDVALQPSLLNGLCEAIHRYHCQPMQWPKHAQTYTSRCENYLHIARSFLDNPRIANFEQRYRDIRHDCTRHLPLVDTPPVCCHNDLNPGNIICLRDSSGATSIRILDWDFASPGVAAMDFASLGVELGVEPALLATTAGINGSQLAAAYRVYIFICDIYREILHAASPNPPKLPASL